jgi:hypothetical protein
VCVFACSETNDVNTGLLIEVWNKGMIWDRALGYYYMPLTEVQYSNEVCNTHLIQCSALERLQEAKVGNRPGSLVAPVA